MAAKGPGLFAYRSCWKKPLRLMIWIDDVKAPAFLKINPSGKVPVKF
jgi:hypothetical protein